MLIQIIVGSLPTAKPIVHERGTLGLAPSPATINNSVRSSPSTVVIYNCPVRTTLKDLRRHFINIAFVTFMRWEQSPYDTNTWKVYASFGSFVDAFNAVRLKGPLLNYPIFKHMASERPKFDSLETVEVECQQGKLDRRRRWTESGIHPFLGAFFR